MRTAFFFWWFLSQQPIERSQPMKPKVILVNIRKAEINPIVDLRFPGAVRLYFTPPVVFPDSVEPLRSTRVSMEGLLRDGGGAVVPAFRPASRFHYAAVYAPFSAVLPYDRFLRLEESTANVLIACLHDPRPVRYVFFWRDGCWLSESSLVSYLTSEERRAVFRLLSAETGTIEPVAAPDARVWFLPGGAEI